MCNNSSNPAAGLRSILKILASKMLIYVKTPKHKVSDFSKSNPFAELTQLCVAISSRRESSTAVSEQVALSTSTHTKQRSYGTEPLAR